MIASSISSSLAIIGSYSLLDAFSVILTQNESNAEVFSLLAFLDEFLDLFFTLTSSMNADLSNPFFTKISRTFSHVCKIDRNMCCNPTVSDFIFSLNEYANSQTSIDCLEIAKFSTPSLSSPFAFLFLFFSRYFSSFRHPSKSIF